jgi:hypothetical protein
VETDQLFQHYLGRAADPTGRAFFVNFLSGGGTLEQAASMLVGSPEYFQGKGMGTNNGWLAAFFQDALGRPLDPMGASFFGGQLAAGATLSAVALEIYSFGEYQNHITDVFFQDFLRRHADAGGLAFFTPFFSVGTVAGADPDTRIIATLLSGTEYAGLVQTQSPVLPVVPADILKSSLP